MATEEMLLKNIRHPRLVAVSVKPGSQVAVVDNVVCAHERQIYPMTLRQLLMKITLSLKFNQMATYT